jgi:hypothetical protein
MSIKRVYDHNFTPEDFDINDYEVNKDGSLTVFQNVILWNKKLKQIPFYFEKIYGFFCCSVNNLTSLEGSPKII